MRRARWPRGIASRRASTSVAGSGSGSGSEGDEGDAAAGSSGLVAGAGLGEMVASVTCGWKCG